MASASASKNNGTSIGSIFCDGPIGSVEGNSFGKTIPTVIGNSNVSPRSPANCQRLRLPSLSTLVRQSRVNIHSAMQDIGVCGKKDGSEVAEVSQIRKEQRRVVVMGAAQVGKTCIISQFLYDKFLPRYKQTIEELHRGEYDLPDGSALTLDILDTSGAFEFPAMRTLSISTAGAFILVYAVNNASSWDDVERLRKEIISARGLKVPIVVVGNKIDLDEAERSVQHEVTEMVVCEDWKCGYVECSAKDNIGIMDIFKELLVQAKIRYNLSPAVRRRRQSLPSYTTSKNNRKNLSSKFSLKRHSCTMS